MERNQGVASKSPMKRPHNGQERQDRTRPIKFSIVCRGKWYLGASRNWNCYEVHVEIAEIAWQCSERNEGVAGSKRSVAWKCWRAAKLIHRDFIARLIHNYDNVMEILQLKVLLLLSKMEKRVLIRCDIEVLYISPIIHLLYEIR